MRSRWAAIAAITDRAQAPASDLTLQEWMSRLRDLASRPAVPALAYLLLITVAELISAFAEPRLGLGLYSAVLIGLLVHAARTWDQPIHELLLMLAFAPLIRILSYALPLAGFPQVDWYFIVSLPLFVAVYLAARTLGYTRAEVGLRVGSLPFQLLVGLGGVAFGYVEYYILRPAPLAPSLQWQDIWLPALILLFSTGFFEELLFRGLMQRAATPSLGRWGVLYVAAVFAVLHIGYKSLVDMIFVFGVALYFGWIVSRTRSLLGVSIAHGLTNIFLFLVVPFVATGFPAQAQALHLAPKLPAIVLQQIANDRVYRLTSGDFVAVPFRGAPGIPGAFLPGGSGGRQREAVHGDRARLIEPRPGAAQRSAASTFKMAMKAKHMRSGTIAVLSTRLSALVRTPLDTVSTSFWSSRANSTAMAINPSDAASATVVTVDTVVVVTVEIMEPPSGLDWFALYHAPAPLSSLKNQVSIREKGRWPCPDCEKGFCQAGLKRPPCNSPSAAGMA